MSQISLILQYINLLTTMKLKNAVIIAFLVCRPFPAWTDNITFRSYGLDFGLTDNAIHDMEEDKYGFIWIATNEGLNRVAGNKIVKYYKEPHGNGLPGNELNCLLDEPDKSTMWIGTQRDGLVSYNYDTGKVEYFRNISTEPQSLVTNDIVDLEFDGKGNLWVATYSNGIEFFDRAANKFIHHKDDNVEGLTNNKFWCMEYDADSGVLFGGHVDEGFSIIDPARRTAKNYSEREGLAGNEVWDMSVDSHYVWIATNNGLSRFNRDTEEIVNFQHPGYSNTIRDIENAGSVLLMTMDNQGVVAFDKQTHKFTTFSPQYTVRPDNYLDILKRSNPNRLLIDSHGNIIVGTLHEGLMAYSVDTNGFRISYLPESNDVHGKEGGAYPDVRTIAAGKDKVWFGTNGSGLLATDGPSYPANVILATEYDSEGTLWTAGNDGNLIQYIPDSGSTIVHRLNLPGHREISLAFHGDTIYIGTIEGVFVFDKKQGEIKGRFDVERNFIFCVKTDNEGNLWVGSYGSGISKLDRHGNVILEYKRENGFVSNTVNDICFVGSDAWVATGEGLVRIDEGGDGGFEVVADSMRSIKSVVADKGGNIWYATNYGIGVVGKDGKKLFFDRQIPLSGFNQASAAVGDNGRIYFGSSHGVVSFNPEYILSGEWLSDPMVAGLIVNGGKDGKDILMNTTGDRIKLNHSQNNFTVVVTPRNFFVEKYAFEYRLLGLEDKWYEMSETGTVTFRDLPYGNYEFQVRNAEMEESTGLHTASLKILIAPPFWLQWWAKLIYVLIVVGICGLLIVWYRNRLRRKAQKSIDEEKLANLQLVQEERVRFFTNVTHELRTPLTLINGPLEDLLKGGTLSKTDQWKVDVIHKNAGKLLNLVNQLLDFRKTETRNKRLCVGKENIVATVKETVMKFVELNRNPNVAISMENSPEEITMYFDKEIIATILDNLISNAMKYTERGIISVTVTSEESEGERLVRISVKDTGYGIGKEALPHIFERYYQENSSHQASGTGIGLALVKGLIGLHNGNIYVDSVKDVGTNFSFTLKRDFDYPEAIHAMPVDAEETTGNDTPEAEPIDEMVDVADKEGDDGIVVLVVEDNPDIMEYIRESLSGMFDVLTATNGREGLEIAGREVPDIIVTDIMMPVMDGMEMTRLLKTDVATSHIPVVMLTAKDTQSAREEGYETGADSYLIKPFSASLLVARINNIISRRHMLTEYFKKNEVVVEEAPATESQSEDLNRDRDKLLSSIGDIDREFLAKVDNLILSGIEKGETVNIDYLIDGVCMSRPTLYRKMKALTGMSANEYTRKVKVSKAKELMLEGRLSLNEIADATGFNSIGYFRESFKAVFGVSPGDFLKSLKSGVK